MSWIYSVIAVVFFMLSLVFYNSFGIVGSVVIFCIGIAYIIPLLWFILRANDAWVYSTPLDIARCRHLAHLVEEYLKSKGVPYKKKYFVHGGSGQKSGKTPNDMVIEYHFMVTMIDGSDITIEVRHHMKEGTATHYEVLGLIINGVNAGNRDGLEMGLHVELMRMLEEVGVEWRKKG